MAKISNADTREGEFLKEICDDYGLQQIIKQPTRGPYLLDLCLTDLTDNKLSILPRIADHNAILFSLKIPVPKKLNVCRKVWHFRGAAWDNLRSELRNWSWARLSQGSVDSACTYFLDSLQSLCKEYIPHSTIEEIKSVHPWLDARCQEAIEKKAAAENSVNYQNEQQACANVLHDAYRNYVDGLKKKIMSLKKSDKRWWKLNRELLQRKSQGQQRTSIA